MEFTYQSTMQLPASYAVLSEDEMVYTVGGAFELNINAQDVLNFTVNVGVNLVRMLKMFFLKRRRLWRIVQKTKIKNENN